MKVFCGRTLPEEGLFPRSPEVNVCCGIGTCARTVPEAVSVCCGGELEGERPVAISVMFALRSIGTALPISIRVLTGLMYCSMRSKLDVASFCVLEGSGEGRNILGLSRLESAESNDVESVGCADVPPEDPPEDPGCEGRDGCA